MDNLKRLDFSSDTNSWMVSCVELYVIPNGDFLHEVKKTM